MKNLGVPNLKGLKVRSELSKVYKNYIGQISRECEISITPSPPPHPFNGQY